MKDKAINDIANSAFETIKATYRSRTSQQLADMNWYILQEVIEKEVKKLLTAVVLRDME